MKKIYYLLIMPALWFGCKKKIEPPLYLGQGMMAGEITTNSVILQTRITASDTLINRDIPGHRSIARFEVSMTNDFNSSTWSDWIHANPETDYIIKTKMDGLSAGSTYFYRAQYGISDQKTKYSHINTFKTLPGANATDPVSFAVTTGMNYYHFHYGKYDRTKAYSGSDKHLGYPALEAIKKARPDYFIGTGDNVYFDHPGPDFEKAKIRGQDPDPGLFDGKEVVDETGMRRKYHVQFCQSRFKSLFGDVGTYWEKDDHDYRFNDADPQMVFPISHALGIKNFREQLPVVDPDDPEAKTYRTFRMNQDLQIWLVEGRDYRSPNQMHDGPDKTLWGKEQLDWLKQTLLESEATFKILVCPTPMVGPDDAYKKDNHTNPEGFRYEGDAFFKWLEASGISNEQFFILCGDRHWQYHAKHPGGFEEFSCGALVDNNSRAGRIAGDSKSTDPDGKIEQFYIQGDAESASGGFLMVNVFRENNQPQAHFRFFDEHGKLLYEVKK